MNERPILFSAPMVKAILGGQKTVTRRVVKPQPPAWATHYLGAQGTYSGVAEPRHYWANHPTAEDAFKADQDFYIWPGHDKSDDEPSDEDIYGAGGFESPWGSEKNCIKPAAHLWVREAWRAPSSCDHLPPRELSGGPVWYEADASVSGLRGLVHQGRLRPGMFMPRWASRITLEVTGVRVERLQDISEADAMAEGAPSADLASGRECIFPHQGTHRWGFWLLWESINGPGSWDANPWVWAVSFKRVEVKHG